MKMGYNYLMKKTKYGSILILLVCSVILVGCTKQNQPVNDQNQVQSQEETVVGSLKDLLGMGKKLECSWEYVDEEGQSKMTGVLWTDGVRSRTQTSTETAGQVYAMNFVTDGVNGYMWEEGKPQGFKYALNEMETEPEAVEEEEVEEEGDQNLKYVDKSMFENYNYQCKGWMVDEAKFSVPTEVEFVDMMAQVQQMQESMEQVQDSLAGVCNSLPEPQKSQCLESMNNQE